jgi:AcrR family transcriptional regulator
LRRAPADAITPEKVIDTAMAMLLRDGLAELTMRRLSDELGVGAPTVYWHVGNREKLLKRLLDRVAQELGAIQPVGRTPAERIASILRSMLLAVRARPHLTELTAAVGRNEVVFMKAEEQLAREVLATGLAGKEAALAVATIMFNFGAFLLLEQVIGEDRRIHGIDRWENASELDDEMRLALVDGVNLDEVYRITVEALLARLLPTPNRARRHGTAEGGAAVS